MAAESVNTFYYARRAREFEARQKSPRSIGSMGACISERHGPRLAWRARPHVAAGHCGFSSRSSRRVAAGV